MQDKDSKPGSPALVSPVEVSTNLALPESPPEIKRSASHFILSLAVFPSLLYLGGSYIDRLETVEEKVKAGIVFVNLALVFAACIFMPSPRFRGFARYFFKLVQSIAFAYFINLVFMTLLVS